MQFQEDACGLRRLVDDTPETEIGPETGCRGTGLRYCGKAGDIWSALHFVLSFQLRKKARPIAEKSTQADSMANGSTPTGDWQPACQIARQVAPVRN